MILKKIALFPGSFDPFTMGHLETIRRGAKLVDELIVGVFINSQKQSFFTTEEKVQLITDAVAAIHNVTGDSQGTAITMTAETR